MFQYGVLLIGKYKFRYVVHPKYSPDAPVKIDLYEPQNGLVFTGDIFEKSLHNIDDIRKFLKVALGTSTHFPPQFYFSEKSEITSADKLEHDFNSETTKSLILILQNQYKLIFHRETFDMQVYENLELAIKNDKALTLEPMKAVHDEIVGELKLKIEKEVNPILEAAKYQTEQYEKSFKTFGNFTKMTQKVKTLEEESNLEKKLNDKKKFEQMFPGSGVATQNDVKFLDSCIGGKPFHGELIYRASKQGFTKHAFHASINLVGPTIIFIRSKNGKDFGVYHEQSWTSGGNFRTDPEAFIFSLTHRTQMKVIDSSKAILCNPDIMIQLGDQDLVIVDNCDKTDCTAKLGSCFEDPTGKGKNSTEADQFLGGSVNFQVAEIEVYRAMNFSCVILPGTITNCLMDKSTMEKLNMWKGGKYRYSLLYKASVDGWMAADFHRCSDLAGETVTIISDENGQNFGGSTSRSWDSIAQQYRPDPKAFLFSITRDCKIAPVSTGCIQNDPAKLVTFGTAPDLFIAEDAKSGQLSSSNLQSFVDSQGRGSITTAQNFKVLEIEVYQCERVYHAQ